MSTNLPVIHRSRLRRYLVAGYAVFIIYASLAPFSGWQEQGLDFRDVLTSPLGLTYTGFDALSNFLAYFPFGLLLALMLRMHFGRMSSTGLAVLLALALSTCMEYLQMYLPMRTSSNADILTNSLGALGGALLAVNVDGRAWFAQLQRWRTGFVHAGKEADFGLALVMLWMFAQVNPSMPMLGNVFITEPAYRMVEALPEAPFSLWESLAVALNLLMLGTLLLTLLRTRRHVVLGLALMLGAVAVLKFTAAAVLLKSWALLLWLNGEAMLGIVIGLALMAVIGGLSRGRLFWVAALSALVYLALVLGVLDGGTPSSAMRLYYWHYGHLRNYNGLSQTVSSLFPLLLCGYLWWARDSRKHEEGNV